MSLYYKEDWYIWKDKFKAWWEGELKEPLIQIIYPRYGGELPYWDSWSLVKHYERVEVAVKSFEEWCSKVCFGGAAYPNLWINFGPGILGAFLGAKLIFTGDTVWFKPPNNVTLEDIREVKLSPKNKWFVIVKEVTKKVSELASGKFIVGITDIGGVLDVIASLRGTNNLIRDMYTSPNLLEEVIQHILDIWHECYEIFYNLINQEGTSAWMGLWCHKKWYPVQCDIAYMFSPKLFDKFVLPHIKEHCERLDYVIYHLDGPGQLIHVDKLLKIDNLDGIQWVPGAAMVEKGYDCGSDRWFPLYRKIQKHGKRLVIGVPFEKVRYVLKNLSHDGLLIQTSCTSKREAEELLREVYGKLG